VTVQLSRREFLAAANAVALLALIESCVPGASRLAATPASTGDPYERALRLLRDAVRASPDHLAQRSAELVAAKDADRIVEFVRDHVSVVPPWSFLDDHRYAQRWGPAATLRGGQGTMRDRAELLADMLTRAGHPAQVMTANRPSSIGLAELYRPRTTKFVPDPKLIEAAKAQLRQAGAPAPANPQTFDQGPDPATAILAALPAQLQTARIRDDLLPARIPIVAFDQGGKKRYAIALGALASTDAAPDGIGNGSAADPLVKVTVTVSAVSSPAPGSQTPRGRQVDLVTGKWGADTVVGRQLLLTFMPPSGPKAYLESALSTQMLRVPVLRVQSDDNPPLLAAGPLVTVHGDVASQGGQVQAGAMDGPLGRLTVLSDADRKKAVARAAGVKVSANATAFPDVALEVNLADASGAPVDGLDARAFSVKEGGLPVKGFTVYSNVRVQQRPRVMVAYDTSSSVLLAWPNPADRAAFEHSLAAAITDAAKQTPFDVQVVALGSNPDPAAWVVPDTSAIASAFANGHSDDDTWATLAGPALDQGVVAIIYVGDSSDDHTDRTTLVALQNRIIASKVPIFVIPTGPPAGPSTQQIVTVSGGARLDLHDPATPAKVAAMVQPHATGWIGGGYRLRYVAPSAGASERNVTVALAERPQMAGSAKYTVPANPIPPPSFVALFATIEVGGLRSVRRIAGLQVNDRGFPLGQLDDPAAIAETRAAIDGITTIAIEPGTPTSAAVLDHVLTSFISVEPLRAIWPVKDPETLFAALKGGFRRTPGLYATLLQPSATDPDAVPGLRVAILQERVTSDVLIERHADLAVGANPMIVVTNDPRAGFKAALINSTAASAAEAFAFDDSAYGRMSGRRLLALPVADLGARNAFYKTVPPEKVSAWTAMSAIYWNYHMVVPAGGDGDAFWLVDPDTGMSKAVLLDGTGGGRMSTGCHFSPFAEMAITLSMLSIMCSLNPEFLPFACLGVTTAATAMTVASLFVPGEADAGTPFGAALGVINPLGAGFGALNAAIGVALILVTIQASCS
jgi:hypothetical protein